MIAHRVLAIIAAALLVVTVGVATFGRGTMSLGQGLYLLNQDMLERALTWSTRTMGDWVWTYVLHPVLVRPAWLLPASAGIICAGLSLTFSNRKAPRDSRRRS